MKIDFEVFNVMILDCLGMAQQVSYVSFIRIILTFLYYVSVAWLE